MFDHNIYKHRKQYTQLSKTQYTKCNIDPDIYSKFRSYAKTRIQTRRNKEQNIYPYAEDPIISKYKFCNVYRELDKQTIYIHTKLLPHTSDIKIRLTNLAIFRFIGNIQTCEKLPIYNYSQNISLIYEKQLRSIQGTKFGDAYLFPPQICKLLGYSDRIDFISYGIPKLIEKILPLLQNRHKMDIYTGVSQITKAIGVGLRFHFTEVLIDLAYQYPDLIDLMGRFPIGPGSKPSMKLLDPKGNVEDICIYMMHHQPHDFPYLQINNQQILITAEGIEGLGCEFRKYTNLSNGKGKKRLYKSNYDQFA